MPGPGLSDAPPEGVMDEAVGAAEFLDFAEFRFRSWRAWADDPGIADEAVW